ncbi:MAG: RNA-binding protein [Pseudohongiellaceae bacterium]|jgi:RNA-binding protein
MELTAAKKKQYRAIGHKLKPIVMIADKGVTEGVTNEIDRALDDHELIKIKLNVNDPAIRKALAKELCESHKAQLVQCIGKMILVLRTAKKQNLKLSNLVKAF